MATSTQPTDHGGLEVLAYDECLRLLSDNYVGRVAFVVAGEPVILPVNYRFHQGAVVLRTTVGEKLHAAARGVPMAFEIDGWDELYRTGWSVLVRGIPEDVVDEVEVAELERLPLRPYASAVERSNWVRIRPDEITGRRIV